ncbi:MAG: SusC/RagA family TonB-linked outer membrane protein [bacterium]
MAHRWSRFLAGAAALVCVASIAPSAAAQNATVIAGRVASKSGEPISGATVLVEATQYGAVTSPDGRYTLTIPASRTGTVSITARLIGYKQVRQQVVLNGRTIAIDWSLTPQPPQLNEVVVTALSQQREKATIGTSQQQVSGEELTKTQAPNLISAMSGKVAGLQISQSGNMGGSTRIVIRGPGSILGNNQPLFVVDGQPISNQGFSTASASGGRDYGSAISDINMDDVASLTVLKGPNAAALYGSRASGGAVVITTKSGRSGPRGTHISFTSRATADNLSVLPQYQNSYGQGFGGDFQYVDGAGGGVNDGGDESWGPRFNGQPIDQFTGKAMPWIAHPDNISQFFRTGSTLSNNLNVSTSGDAMGARLSVTKDDIRGIVPNSSLSKLATTLSATATLMEKLNVSGNLQYVQNSGMNRPENGYTEGNPFMTFTWFGRQVDVASLKNHYYNTASPYGFADGSLYNWNDNYHRNPYWQVFQNPAPDSRDRVIGQASASYELAPWLTGLLRAGSDEYRQTAEQDFAAGNIDNASPSYSGGFSNNTNRARETNFEGLLTAKKNLAFADLTFNLGGNRRRNDSYNAFFGTSGILVPGIYNLSNAGIAPTVTNSEFHSAVNSSYGSVVATIKQVWTVEVTGRNDWSSTLPKESASYFYPSVNSALVLSDLFPSIQNSVISFVKLRGGWTRVGSDATPYQLATTYNGNTNKFGGLAQYSLVNTNANPLLRPERTTAQEAGAEIGVFDDRITFDGTYYVKKSRDQIMNLTTAPATGFSATAINAGLVSNRGFEAMVSAKVLKLRNGFTWTSTINYLRNRNKVDSLAPGLASTDIATQWGSAIQAREGQPYGVLWGYAWQRDSASGKLLTSGGLPLQSSAKQILGNVNPDYTGGWSNEFRYKNWALSSLLDVRHGGQNFSIGNWWGMYAGILSSTLKGREVDWDNPKLLVDGIDKATGKPNTTKVTAEDYGHNLYPVPEAAVFNSGFVKLREVRLSWEVPSSVAGRVNLSQMNVAFVGRNLMTWTSFPNYDPENATNAGNGGQGYDMGAMPTTRSFGINVTVTP